MAHVTKKRGSNPRKQSIAFTDLVTAGEEGFHNVAKLIETLNEADLSLAEDSTYRKAGLRNYNDLARRAERHAIAAAIAYFDAGKKRAGDEIKLDTLDTHAVECFETAFGWMQKTTLPLFSDRSYAALGATSEQFFKLLQAAHIDAVRQKLRITSELLDVNPEDVRAANIMKKVYKVHLPRLGIEDINDRNAQSLGTDSETIMDLYHRAQRGKLRGLIRASSYLRFKNPNATEYFESIVTAKETLRILQEDLDNDPETFAGLNYTAKTFENEFNRALEGLVHHEMQLYRAGGLKNEDIFNMMERLGHWRSLHGEAEVPEGTPVIHQHEDYWFYDIFTKYDFRSFSHLMNDLRKIYATVKTAEIIKNLETLSAAEVHDELLDVENMLIEARVPMDRDSAFEEIHIDRSKLKLFLDASAADVAIRDWSHSFDLGQTTEFKLQLLDRACKAATRVYGTEYAQGVPDSMGRAADTKIALMLRRAEEYLACARICLDEEGALIPLAAAFEIFEGLEMDFPGHNLAENMGMTPELARHYDAWHARLNLARWWRDIIDEDGESPIQRFLWRQHFDDEFSHLDLMQQKELQALMEESDETMREHAVKLAQDTIDAAAVLMQSDPNDILSAAENLVHIRNSLNTINPKALENDVIFFEIMKYPRTRFLELEQNLKLRAAALIDPNKLQEKKPFANDNDVGFIVPEIMARHLRQALNLKGADAVNAITKLARDAARVAQTITDTRILTLVNLTRESLAHFIDTQSLTQARVYLDAAMAKGAMAVTLTTMENHAYNDFVRVLTWVGRTRHTLLEDAPYQALGLASRTDFVTRMRDSLFDFVSQMEKGVLNEGMKVGPIRYLRILKEIRDGYSVLGLERIRDDFTAKSEIGDPQGGIGADTVRLALKGVGYTACNAILRNPNLNATGKYNQITQIFNFAERMNATSWGEADHMLQLNKIYADLIAARIDRVLTGGLIKQVSDPARAIRVAWGINELRVRREYTKAEFFTAVFQKNDYADFTAFAERAAIDRISQLNARIIHRLNGHSIEAMSDVRLNRDILQDVSEIRDILKSDLVDDDRVEDILQSINIDREFLDITFATASVLVLPFMMELTRDPTLTVAQRKILLQEVKNLRDTAGPELPMVKKLHWPMNTRLCTHTLLQSVASDIMPDMLRGEFDSMSHALLNANTTLALNGKTLADLPTLRRMGLNDAEARKLKALEPLAVPFAYIDHMETLPIETPRGDSEESKKEHEQQISNIYNAVMTLNHYAKKRGIDLTAPETLARLGLKSEDEFSDIVDSRTLKLIAGFCDPLANVVKPENGVVQASTVLEVLDLTGLEKRVSAKVIQEAGILDRAAVEAMIARFSADAAAAKKQPAATLSPS